MDPNISKATTGMDQKSLLAAVHSWKKHNLMVVGGHEDNIVDLCGEDDADAKRQCLGKGHTMLTKQPSQAEFEECCSESIKNGLSRVDYRERSESFSCR
jgi:hypothetical protein